MAKAARLWWWLVPVLLITCWLGARSLNDDVIWSDEYYSILDAGGGPYGPQTLDQIWNGVATRNPWHTPGFFMLFSAWGRLAGWDPAMGRTFALLFGLLAVAWTYRLGRDHVSPRVGLYMAVILGTSTYFAYYLHEIRMYTIITLLTAYTLWIYLRILRARAEPRRIEWLGLIGGAVAMLYTHYFAALPLIAVGVYHVLFAWRDVRDGHLSRRRWWRVLGALALAALAFTPWIGALIAGLNRAVAAEELHDLALDNQQVLTWLFNIFSNGHVVLLLVFAVLSLTAIHHRVVQRAWLLALALLMFILTINGVLEIIKVSRIRYLITLFPLLALIVAVGIDRLRRWNIPPVVGLAAWVVLGFTGTVTPAFIAGLDSSTYIFPMQDEVHEMRGRIQPGDWLINYFPPGLPGQRYRKNAEFYFAGMIDRVENMQVETTDDYQRVVHGDRFRDLQSVERLWFAYMPDNPPPLLSEFQAGLEETYLQCGVIREQRNLRLTLYAQSDVCCIPDTRPAVPQLQFGDRIALVGSELTVSPIDGSLSAVLSWQIGADVPLHTYSVALHLIDAAGNKVGQADYGLRPAVYDCQRAAIPLTDLPAGEYEVRAGVYAWQTGEQLTGRDSGGAEGVMLRVGSVTLE